LQVLTPIFDAHSIPIASGLRAVRSAHEVVERAHQLSR
jgi:hypothetical protein